MDGARECPALTLALSRRTRPHHVRLLSGGTLSSIPCITQSHKDVAGHILVGQPTLSRISWEVQVVRAAAGP